VTFSGGKGLQILHDEYRKPRFCTISAAFASASPTVSAYHVSPVWCSILLSTFIPHTSSGLQNLQLVRWSLTT